MRPSLCHCTHLQEILSFSTIICWHVKKYSFTNFNSKLCSKHSILTVTVTLNLFSALFAAHSGRNDKSFYRIGKMLYVLHCTALTITFGIHDRYSHRSVNARNLHTLAKSQWKYYLRYSSPLHVLEFCVYSLNNHLTTGFNYLRV